MINQTFCITGELNHFDSREAAFQEIISHGWKISKIITVTCDFLVIGDKGSQCYSHVNKGNKQIKAEQWQAEGYPIKIISEDKFMEMLEEKNDLTQTDIETVAILKTESSFNIDSGIINVSRVYNPQKSGQKQILRITFHSESISKASGKAIANKIKRFKSEYKNENNQIIAECDLIPANDDDDSFIAESKIVIPLINDNLKGKSITISEEIEKILIAMNTPGTISIRIWNEFQRYGIYWLKKFKTGF